MELARRTRWLSLSLPVALAAAAMLVRPAPPGLAAAGPMTARSCPSSGATTAGADGVPAWYRMDPQLDAGGTLVGQTLTVGRGTARWGAVLPPESFASGPVRGRVLVGDDDGRRSRLRVLDTERGCWTELGTAADVIRSALLAPDGIGLYEHRVDRGSRRDLGVWRRDPRLSTAPELFMAPLHADADSGPTFATSLLVDEDGRLAVNACGEFVCRTRVVDAGSHVLSSVAETGPLFGMARDRLLVLDVCAALPCPVSVVDLDTGARTAVGSTAGPAALADAAGTVVVTGADGLSVEDSARGDASALRGTAGLAPILRTSTADSGFEAPAGRVAVAPGGRVTDPTKVRLLDPASLQLTAGEVQP